MDITLMKDYLLNTIHALSRITTNNKNLPIIACVNIEATQKQLIIKATNLEIGAILKVRASIDKEGSVAVPMKFLLNSIEGISDLKIKLKKEGNNLKIIGDKVNLSIKGFPVEEFPIIPKIKNKEVLTILVEPLITALEAVLPSVAISEMRPDLAGVFLVIKDKEIRLVATDGFRLAEKVVKINKERNVSETIIQDKNNFLTKGVIIPSKNVSEIIKVLTKEKKEQIDILLEESQIAFKNENIFLISRVLDGNFPDYLQIIPKDKEMELFINKDNFLKAIKLTALFSDPNSLEVVFKVNSKKNKIELFSKSKEIGEAKNEILFKGEVKEDKKFILNYRFVIDGINQIKNEELRLILNSEKSPILIKTIKENDFLYLISPINKE